MIAGLRVTGAPGGIVARRGAPCGVPGLAVAQAVASARGWCLVHARSGLAVAYFAGPEAALAAAQAVAGLADWTRPAAELRAAVRDAVLAALSPLGAEYGMNPGDTSDLPGACGAGEPAGARS